MWRFYNTALFNFCDWSQTERQPVCLAYKPTKPPCFLPCHRQESRLSTGCKPSLSLAHLWPDSSSCWLILWGTVSHPFAIQAYQPALVQLQNGNVKAAESRCKWAAIPSWSSLYDTDALPPMLFVFLPAALLVICIFPLSLTACINFPIYTNWLIHSPQIKVRFRCLNIAASFHFRHGGVFRLVTSYCSRRSLINCIISASPVVMSQAPFKWQEAPLWGHWVPLVQSSLLNQSVC